MIGYSGSYAINGTTIFPETGQWVERDILGYDGSGRPIYPALGDFELSWGLMSIADLKTLVDAQLFTGTTVVDLPQWGAVGFLFYSYSGTYVNRASVGTYFVDTVSDVRVIISNVRTT